MSFPPSDHRRPSLSRSHELDDSRTTQFTFSLPSSSAPPPSLPTNTQPFADPGIRRANFVAGSPRINGNILSVHNTALGSSAPPPSNCDPSCWECRKNPSMQDNQPFDQASQRPAQTTKKRGPYAKRKRAKRTSGVAVEGMLINSTDVDSCPATEEVYPENGCSEPPQLPPAPEVVASSSSSFSSFASSYSLRNGSERKQDVPPQNSTFDPLLRLPPIIPSNSDHEDNLKSLPSLFFAVGLPLHYFRRQQWSDGVCPPHLFPSSSSNLLHPNVHTSSHGSLSQTPTPSSPIPAIAGNSNRPSINGDGQRDLNEEERGKEEAGSSLHNSVTSRHETRRMTGRFHIPEKRLPSGSSHPPPTVIKNSSVSVRSSQIPPVPPSHPGHHYHNTNHPGLSIVQDKYSFSRNPSSSAHMHPDGIVQQGYGRPGQHHQNPNLSPVHPPSILITPAIHESADDIIVEQENESAGQNCHCTDLAPESEPSGQHDPYPLPFFRWVNDAPPTKTIHAHQAAIIKISGPPRQNEPDYQQSNTELPSSTRSTTKPVAFFHRKPQSGRRVDVPLNADIGETHLDIAAEKFKKQNTGRRAISYTVKASNPYEDQGGRKRVYSGPGGSYRQAGGSDRVATFGVRSPSTRLDPDHPSPQVSGATNSAYGVTSTSGATIESENFRTQASHDESIQEGATARPRPHHPGYYPGTYSERGMSGWKGDGEDLWMRTGNSGTNREVHVGRVSEDAGNVPARARPAIAAISRRDVVYLANKTTGPGGTED